ncbi:putative F-box/LRR-repeat protein 23 isoform X1 [Panicum miliaceum]|uniref:F-box/LRR-repeat protein 23 isoform X1 n=1 Tax=Panicum miliaceum TaxID=4540 RepID=A0A3L6PRY8_PANMI|nr:putative F-box/LRR-repeat protein 23 isoform X1 [Panicum miliaceum]
MRNWAALPRDVLLDVFLRLGSRGVMRGAELACAPWRDVAVGEPALWRRVDMATVRLWSPGWRGMVRAAVDRGAGQCVAFAGPADDDSLLYLVDRAPCLKSLHLLDVSASSEVLNKAIKELPFLEDLEISPSYFSTPKFESVSQACPRLKTLILRLHMPFGYGSDKLAAVPIMWELRTLQLLDCELTTDGLKSILDSCPLLESLHITGSLIGSEMDEEVRGKCARVRNLTLPDYDPPGEAYDHDGYSDWYWYGM